MVSITVNSDEVELNIDKFIDETLLSKLSKAMTNACLKVEADAKELCPVQDGILRQSIQSDVEIDNEEVKGYVGSNVFYAPFVHNGTGIYAKDGNGRKEIPWRFKDNKGEWHTTEGIKPTPFLYDAVNKNKADIINYFKGVIGE